jgi:N-hydroxyarylamine O-acetyltransferase
VHPPTIATLTAMHARHTAAIAFENLDPLLRRPMPLDSRSLQDKLVRGGRGGWCFEQNQVFALALRALGFEVTGLAARVVWNQPGTEVTRRSHMVLRVEVAGEPWIADVGFGGQTLTAPLRLEVGLEQATPHEPFRLIEDRGYYLMQSKIDGEWKSLFRFDLVPAFAPDYEVANWFLCTHPSSHFLQMLTIARALPGQRITLRNNEFAIHTPAGTQRRTVTSAREIRNLLEREFGLRLPDDPNLEPTLHRIARQE